MDIFIKICGIGSLEDASAVAAMGPDALGFVLWPKSPRAVAPDDLARWLPRVKTSALKVGVFVEPDPAEVIRVVRRAGLDAVQLHGEVDPAPYQVAGVPVWLAVHADRISLRQLSVVRVDALVADTYSKQQPGGTGITGDWEAVRALAQSSRTPVVLAGGLKPFNVRTALRAVNPWGVDASSGVEARPGKKDLNKVQDFIKQCRTA